MTYICVQSLLGGCSCRAVAQEGLMDKEGRGVYHKAQPQSMQVLPKELPAETTVIDALIKPRHAALGKHRMWCEALRHSMFSNSFWPLAASF